MAVYTDVSAEDLERRFSRGYDLGELLSYKGIAEGVENSNFLVHTSRGYFILTLYEKRVAAGDLPFFLGADGASGRARHHLSAAGEEPRPARRSASSPAGRPRSSPSSKACGCAAPTAQHCAAVGEALARLHLAGARFSAASAPMRCRSPAGGRSTRAAATRADNVQPGLRRSIAGELDYLEDAWPRDLPQGVIHADLFPDNVFFLGDKLSGLIDFYFACTDMLAYDVAICLNAWCFEPDHSYNVTKGRALLQGYAKVRPLSAAEREALPLLARGAALRFLLTRLVDWLDVPPGALVRPKDPLEYFRKLRFHQSVASVRDYGIDASNGTDGSERGLPHVIIHTDGACSGNPGPGGWGAILNSAITRRN